MLTVKVDNFGIVTAIIEGEHELFNCAPISVHGDIDSAFEWVNTTPGQYNIAIYEKTS